MRMVCKAAKFVFNGILNLVRYLTTAIVLSFAILLAKYDSEAEFHAD